MNPRQHLGSRGKAAPMSADGDQTLLELAPGLIADAPAGGRGARVIHPGTHMDRSGAWLRNASAGLGVLAAAAAVVSFTAQYRMIFAARRLALVAGLEAAIPDAAAVVFASLGIALALHGRRALRARALNVASVTVSVLMNAIAAAPGWRSLAIWAMPPVLSRPRPAGRGWWRSRAGSGAWCRSAWSAARCRRAWGRVTRSR